MTKEEFLKSIENEPRFTVIRPLRFDNINHKPHLYCITEKHITDNYVVIDSNTINSLERKHGCMCGMYVNPTNPDKYTNGYKKGWNKCNVPYNEHTSETALWIEVTKDTNTVKINEEMKVLSDLISKSKLHCDGFLMTKKDEIKIEHIKEERSTND